MIIVFYEYLTCKTASNFEIDFCVCSVGWTRCVWGRDVGSIERDIIQKQQLRTSTRQDDDR